MLMPAPDWSSACSITNMSISRLLSTPRTAYESSERIYREAERWGPTTTESATEHHEGRLWFFTAWDPFDPYAWDILSGMFIRTDEPQGWTYEEVRGAG